MASKGLSAEEAKIRAQRNFAKLEQRRQEAESALEAVRAERQAVAEKTARLRALRLAKEAADADAALKAPPPPVKASRVRRAK